MQFKNWFENKISDETINRTVSLWTNLKEQVPFNQIGISNFINVMSNKNMAEALAKLLFQKANYDVYLYQEPIAGELLNVTSEILQNAIGVINDVKQGSAFFFCMTQEVDRKSLNTFCPDVVVGKVMAGNLLIRIPPIAFIDQKDKIMLKSIIIHELTHAYYWNIGEFRKEADMPLRPTTANFESGAYLRNLYEATAYVQQLDSLIQDIGKNNLLQLIQYLKNNQFTHQGFMDLMLPYIYEYFHRVVFNEMSDVEKYKNQQESYKQVAVLLEEIFALMSFKNFIK